MYKRILLLLLSLLTVPTAQAQNQLSLGQKAQLLHQNLLTNPGYEAGLSGWTKSGVSTLTQNTTATNIAYGNASAAWTPANNGETLTSAQVTVPPGIYGTDCVASVYVKGGSSAISLQAISGVPAVLATETLQTESAFKRYELRFACPSSGTFAVRLQASGSSSVIYVDQWQLASVARQPAEYFSNAVSNGNAEDNYVPSGWATYSDGAVAAPVDGTGGSPTHVSMVRDTSAPIDGKASWKLSTAGSTAAEGEGWAYSFTIPTNSQLKNALNDLTFDYYQDNTTSDLVRVYLYDVTNSLLITPQFTSCGGGTAPSLASLTSGQTCHAELAWLATTGTSYRLIFHVSDNAGAVTAAHNLWVDNIFVGQHKVAVGPQVGPWTTYSPTITNQGTVTTTYAEYRRNGENIEMRGYFAFSVPTANPIKVPLPPGVTGRTGGSNVVCAGSAGTDYVGLTSVSGFTPVIMDADKGSLQFSYNVSRSILTPANGSAIMGNGSVWVFQASCPANEFTGGSAFGENKCEYAYNTTAWGSADASTYGYGPQGATITGALTSDKQYVVQFATSISATDTEELQFSTATTGPWMTAGQFNDGTNGGVVTYDNGSNGTTDSGAVLRPNTSNSMRVLFGRYAQYGSYNASGTGVNWVNGWLWRVKKCKAGIPTAFGLANSNIPGLYSAGNAPGSLAVYSANAYPVGAVGEYFERNVTSNIAITSSTTTDIDGTGITLTPGTWDISGVAVLTPAASTNITVMSAWVGTASGAVTTGRDVNRNYTQLNYATGGAVTGVQFTNIVLPTWRVSISSTTTYYLKVDAAFTVSTMTANGTLRATRVN